MNIRTKIKKINWYQAAAEVLLILIGLLIAVAVDSWWDERVERSEELDNLQSLKTDLISNRKTLEVVIQRTRKIIEKGKALHSDINSGILGSSSKEINQNIGNFYNIPSFYPTTGTYDEMIGEGNLQHIQNRNLRIMLTQYTKIFDEVKDYTSNQWTNWEFTQAPYLSENYLITNMGWIGGYKPNMPFEANMDALKTKKFANLISLWMIMQHNLLITYEVAYDTGEEIIALIDSELSQKT